MATFAEIADMKDSVPLRRRVEAAIAKVAMYVIGSEAASAPNHRNRLKWAFDASQAPQVFSDRMIWAVCGNGTIQASYVTNHNTGDIADGDIEYVVNVMVDQFATGF